MTAEEARCATKEAIDAVLVPQGVLDKIAENAKNGKRNTLIRGDSVNPAVVLGYGPEQRFAQENYSALLADKLRGEPYNYRVVLDGIWLTISW